MVSRNHGYDLIHDPFVQGRLLSLEEVLAIVGAPRSTLYEWIAADLFPAPVRVGKRGSRWRAAEVVAWIESLPVATLSNLH